MSLLGILLSKHRNRDRLTEKLSLKHFVTLAVLLVFTLLIAFSTYRSVSLRLAAERANILDQLRRDVALLVRHAEVGLYNDVSLLKEELAYITADTRISQAAIIDQHDTVLVAKDYAWLRQPTSALLSPAALAIIEKARRTRFLLTADDTSGERTLLLVMSYAIPQQQKHLRAIDRGVVFMAFNLTLVREHALEQAFQVAVFDALLLTVLLTVLLWLLHTVVTRPLRKIVQYSKQDLTDAHLPPVRLTQAPRDLHELADAISEMRAVLHRQVEELREKGELNSLILDNTDDGFVTITDKGIMVAVSRSMSTIFGYQADEMIGANVSLLMPSPDREHHDYYLARHEAGHAPHFVGRRRELMGRRKDGSLFPLELRVSQILRKGEVFFVGSLRDITERSQLEQAKNEFVSIVSHELRTPLTAINGSLGLILGTVRAQLTPTLLNLIEIAHRNGLRLLALINDLLDMEKLMAGQMVLDARLHPVNTLIHHSLELMKPYSLEHQVMITFTPGMDGQILVDSNRLHQILSNLLSNAIKFSSPGTYVEVESRVRPGRVRISVRDHGPGIPESFRGRVFEKFAQANAADNRQKGGTGLGLAITRELVERMGGTIGFHTETDNGTEFFIEFGLVIPEQVETGTH